MSKKSSTQEGDVIMPHDDKGIHGIKNPDVLKTIANTPENEIIGKNQQPDVLGNSDKVASGSSQKKNND